MTNLLKHIESTSIKSEQCNASIIHLCKDNKAYFCAFVAGEKIYPLPVVKTLEEAEESFNTLERLLK